MTRILIIQLKRIGDLILTAPALTALRAAMPDAELVMVTPANVAELATCIPALNRVIPYRAKGLNMEAWASAVAGPWDACLDFTGTDRSALLTTFSHARRRIGFAKFARNKLRRLAFTDLCAASVRDLHTLDFHLALVAVLTGKAPQASSPVLSLKIPDGTLAAARSKLVEHGVTGRYVIIHPGTAKAEKFWMASRWAEVISHVQKTLHLSVVLTGSADGLEKSHLVQLKGCLHTPVADITGKLSMVELAALISECELMVGVDSMAMHLAAMFQRPQVAIFGPTNPFHWRPLHDRAAVVMGDAAAPVEHFNPRENKHEMKQVSTRQVIDAIGRILPVATP